MSPGNFQRLVEDTENVNYNSMDQGASPDEPQAGPSQRRSSQEQSAGVDGDMGRRKFARYKTSKRAPLVSFFMFAMKQSYVLMLIAMMVSLC